MPESKKVIDALKAMCRDTELVALNSFGVRGKLDESVWKHDDPRGYALWKRGMNAIAQAAKIPGGSTARPVSDSRLKRKTQNARIIDQ